MKSVYRQTSPFAKTPQFSWYLDLWEPITIPIYANDPIFPVIPKYNNRPDLAAFDLYGKSTLWWVFAKMNPDLIKDPIWDFKTGMVLRVAPRSRIDGLF